MSEATKKAHGQPEYQKYNHPYNIKLSIYQRWSISQLLFIHYTMKIIMCNIIDSLVATWLLNYFDGLVQDCSISIANVLEILQPCTRPSMSCVIRSCQWFLEKSSWYQPWQVIWKYIFQMAFTLTRNQRVKQLWGPPSIASHSPPSNEWVMNIDHHKMHGAKYASRQLLIIKQH